MEAMDCLACGRVYYTSSPRSLFEDQRFCACGGGLYHEWEPLPAAPPLDREPGGPSSPLRPVGSRT